MELHPTNSWDLLFSSKQKREKCRCLGSVIIPKYLGYLGAGGKSERPPIKHFFSGFVSTFSEGILLLSRKQIFHKMFSLLFLQFPLPLKTIPAPSLARCPPSGNNSLSWDTTGQPRDKKHILSRSSEKIFEFLICQRPYYCVYIKDIRYITDKHSILIRNTVYITEIHCNLIRLHTVFSS